MAMSTPAIHPGLDHVRLGLALLALLTSGRILMHTHTHRERNECCWFSPLLGCEWMQLANLLTSAGDRLSSDLYLPTTYLLFACWR